ncbi:MAG TPA: hypothetical protein PLT63_06605 [Syntrophales bacterium]|jgi:Holliday junction resolvasome RuvABC DNA-binding subunit|nr:hypothetical protein [Syntrophales bacterium]
MPSKKSGQADPASKFKLRKRTEGILEKEDISEIVGTGVKKAKPITYTLRYSENESQMLQKLTDEVNAFSTVKTISKNDVIRALIVMGYDLSREKILNALRSLI